MSKKGYGKLVLGAAVGATLGVLFAPKKGSETREDLKKAFDDLANKIKNLDKEEVKKYFELKVNEIKEGIMNLDKETVVTEAKKKAKKVKDATNELVKYAVEKGTPIIQKSAENVNKKVNKTTKEITDKLEKEEK